MHLQQRYRPSGNIQATNLEAALATIWNRVASEQVADASRSTLSHFHRIFHEQGTQERPNLSLGKHFTAHTTRPGQNCLLHYLPKVHVTSHSRQQEY